MPACALPPLTPPINVFAMVKGSPFMVSTIISFTRAILEIAYLI